MGWRTVAREVVCIVRPYPEMKVYHSMLTGMCLLPVSSAGMAEDAADIHECVMDAPNN